MSSLNNMLRRSIKLALSRQAAAFGGLFMVLLMVLAGLTPQFKKPPIALAGASPETIAKVKGQVRGLPLYFIENQGQLDKQVAYNVQGRDTSVYFTNDGITLTLQEPPPPAARDASRAERQRRSARNEYAPAEDARKLWAVKLRFVGSEPVNPHGEAKASATINYFKGPQADWKTGLPSYASVVYPQVWPGIDVVYTGDRGHVKATYQVQAGVDPRQIRLAYQGATSVALTEAGRLAVQTPVGGFEEDTPVAYQEIDGRHVPVEARYTLTQAAANEWHYGFALGDYDQRQPLFIDPTTLVYCGYVGGGGLDEGRGIAVDSLGQAYLTGITHSSDFPVRAGPDLTPNGDRWDHDAFVVKVSADGKQLVYAGYIGGSRYDEGYGIAVDGMGQAYVVGLTESRADTFPVRVGPGLSHGGGYHDAFVAKVSADGSQLLYAGYLGGSGEDDGRGIAVDGLGQAYVVGTAGSDQTTFPVRVGPDITYNGARGDAFVAKISADGAQLIYSGYIGGKDYDRGAGVAVDGSGQAYVVGQTWSDGTSFPLVVGPDIAYNGVGDAFVARVSPDGTQLTYSGYIGGGGYDEGTGIAVDGNGQAYVVGNTNSTEASFPVRVGPDLSYNGGGVWGNDAFVAKVSVNGAQLVYAGYIGGSGGDIGNGIAVDSLGQAYVVGSTGSSESEGFPLLDGPDLTYNGELFDAFVAKVSANGAQLAYAGYIGGSDVDKGYGIAVDGSGQAYVVGLTPSSQSTFPVRGGPDLTYNGNLFGDAFVAKVGTNTGQPANSAECFFNQAERYYSSLFSPTGSPTAVWSVYIFRYYSATNAYLAVSSVDNHVYYLGPDGQLRDEGPLSYWSLLAGCP